MLISGLPVVLGPGWHPLILSLPAGASERWERKATELLPLALDVVQAHDLFFFCPYFFHDFFPSIPLWLTNLKALKSLTSCYTDEKNKNLKTRLSSYATFVVLFRCLLNLFFSKFNGGGGLNCVPASPLLRFTVCVNVTEGSKLLRLWDGIRGSNSAEAQCLYGWASRRGGTMRRGLMTGYMYDPHLGDLKATSSG